ncbi:hypothetical protein MIND_01126400 [Mycena indigotica]|uniref:Uncharacterized protein n=1 Tax=Mycena indigotica TaxID=2126181 RepID=A0A8H6S8Z3_9AGAR|nr:uncharacterized protein MIND_01126400 [Mycena indigotica]KAF7293485.1 hypothetical protein MIND_01126400 [Mycena indigotica]
MTQLDSLPAPSPFMLFSIFLTPFCLLGRSGAIGHIPWSDIVGVSSPESGLAQLSQIGITYNISRELAIRPVHDPRGSLRIPAYPSALLLGPHIGLSIEQIPLRVRNALATRFNIKSGANSRKELLTILREATFLEWTKLRCIDSTAGDTMVADLSSASHSRREDRRDPTFVRYEMLVDIYANDRKRKSEFQRQTFFGQLQHIYLISLNNLQPINKYKIGAGECIIMVEIQNCKLDWSDERTDTHYYHEKGTVDAGDATILQCLVGRVPDGSRGWAIVDRSGSLARAAYLDDEEE